MPPILDTNTCPHCKAEVPKPTPRVCPACAGSLQKRHLRAGCLHSGPALLLAAALLSAVLAAAVSALDGRGAAGTRTGTDGTRAPR